MFLATSNKSKRLLYISYIGKVDVAELQRGSQDLRLLLAELPDGFKMLVELDRLESMDISCIEELGKMMELFDQHGLEQVVRVIPDPTKDIGFNILARFHYHNNPRMTNCETMIQAAKLLGL
jgi:anti-anti-sigma regulatory factor